jgi:hypothetical protein
MSDQIAMTAFLICAGLISAIVLNGCAVMHWMSP